ncbi:MAG: hypothetical protein D6730_05400 [Bacteroidetes bacterium]|nr:MAG: hypothetical protein D6730_05400 [Bacteroidota bacterium]
MKYVLIACLLFILPFLIAQDALKPSPGRTAYSLGEPLPASFSLRAYAPASKDQGKLNNCVGWAVAYSGRTILEAIAKGWTEQEEITRRAFDPGFAYYTASGGRDTFCLEGVVIQDAVTMLRERGALPRSYASGTCACSLPDSLLRLASQYTIADYETLFYINDPAAHKIRQVKSRLAQQQPVIVGMRCPPSFEDAIGQEVWQAAESPQANVFFGHAVCVVGYDDHKFGGAFEVQNSWGKSWGKDGFIWIRYRDFANFSKYAYNLIPHPRMLDAHSLAYSASKNKKKEPAHAGAKAAEKTAASPLSKQQASLEVVASGGLKMNSMGEKGQYELNIPYTYGESLHLHLKGDQYPYMYVFGWNEQENISILYSQNRKLSPEKWQKLQEEGILIDTKRLAGEIQTGTDHLCVLFAHNSLEPEVILKQLREQKGNVKKRILKLLDGHLPASKEVQYQIDQLGFSALTSKNVMIPVFIDAFHLP